MVTQHSPLQKVKEARQIAKDTNLFITEKQVGARTDYFLYRKTPTGPVYIGKRGSPEGIRSFVVNVAGFR